MKRYFFDSDVTAFIDANCHSIIGEMTEANPFPLESSQRDAWRTQVDVLKSALQELKGHLFLEYSIPRMGRRIDAVVVLGCGVFVVEFKVGKTAYSSADLDQVFDYALDLKHFHEPSHTAPVVPILVATDAPHVKVVPLQNSDGLFAPLKANRDSLKDVMRYCAGSLSDIGLNGALWAGGRYSPTPTIVEAAAALYGEHSVEDISRSDAGAMNLLKTSAKVSEIIEKTNRDGEKAICFVTGVPGAGKTLVGLDIATKHNDAEEALYSVFLSGNGPLVMVLNEALARDAVRIASEKGQKLKKKTASSKVKKFIQNVHHFRDECLADIERPPIEHVALFDEAQRAWNLEQTASFMKRKKRVRDFSQSESEFLISCLDRHKDWAVIVCLVGGGQEINTGEAGIGAWIDAIKTHFPKWKIYISPNLRDREFSVEAQALAGADTFPEPDLHLAVSMRSFRSERVSELIKCILDIDKQAAASCQLDCSTNYPIVLTRDIQRAKDWLRAKARGTERTGIVVSSQALRLRPQGIHVKAPMNPIHWFLGGKDDIRSSYYLEDVATEFHIQGLEVDWSCVAWDADLRMVEGRWEHWSFKGSRWQRIHKRERQQYLLNAYRVLLTRARQGMVIVVPEGDSGDHTRLPAFYDPTFEYLSGLGIAQI
jgi:broad-specificity NMP kinase